MFPATMNELTIRLAMEPKLFDNFMTYEVDCVSHCLLLLNATDILYYSIYSGSYTV